MRRREFIAGLGGAAAWPLAAGAQQPSVSVIGILSTISRETTSSLAPFLDGLREAGFIDGQNVRIEYRSAEGRYDRLPALAADLVDRRVTVLFAIGGPLIAKPARAANIDDPHRVSGRRFRSGQGWPGVEPRPSGR